MIDAVQRLIDFARTEAMSPLVPPSKAREILDLIDLLEQWIKEYQGR